MPVSTDGILEATFDPAWAAVRLIVDGGMWPDPVSVIDVTRQTPGQAAVPVRGLEHRAAVGGTYVGTDHEMPLESSVTYSVTGYDDDGLAVATSTVTVDTAGAGAGLWIKVAGKPDLTVRAELRPIGSIASPTIGGVYQIAGGGGSVAQTTAQWSGIESESAQVIIAVAKADAARLRRTLEYRQLLLQPTPESELDAGWYFLARVDRFNPSGMVAGVQREFILDVQRTGVPAGEGAGIADNSWARVMDEFATWQDVIDAYDTWFDVLRGA